MFIIIVFDMVLKRSSPVSSQDFYYMFSPRFGVSINKKCTSFRVLASLSGYYYYDYVVLGVLRQSWFREILFWIRLLLSKDDNQLKIITFSLQ